MSPKLLFKAFERATNQKHRAEIVRGSGWGIAVHDDYWALRWQRYDRLVAKLRKRLLEKLEE